MIIEAFVVVSLEMVLTFRKPGKTLNDNDPRPFKMVTMCFEEQGD